MTPTRARLLVALGDDRMGMLGVLERSGYDIERAANLEEMLQLVEKLPFDALMVGEHFGAKGDAMRVLNAPLGELRAVVLGDTSVLHDQALRDHPRVAAVVFWPFTLYELQEALASAGIVGAHHGA